MFALSEDEWAVMTLSLEVATGSLLVNILPALGFGWLLARKSFWGKSLLETVIFLPLVLPPVVPGYILLRLFGGQGVFGQALASVGLELAFNRKGAVLAATVMGFPLMVQAVRLAIELVDTNLEAAAKTLGASAWQAFWQVTLPLSWGGILVGAVLAFCRSLGEFGATMTFVGNIAGETRTLPLAMYSLLQQPDRDAAVMRLMGMSLIIAFAALWLSQWYSRRQRQRLLN
ncbi:molybdate ABC transporter permease subunit [Faucicola atlantae]|uniref:Molybdenum transport system permease n=1 Tax=Faucicola atlantae TaxID=34059 RepID=A0A1B8QKF8_9GAMM|nr:molybdate ABC transporter permease subunit [Moraxella atlantae]OBX83989.1 molybdate ABC transporter permease [Moraxella atlantae]